jgi:hypothetical protein
VTVARNESVALFGVPDLPVPPLQFNTAEAAARVQKHRRRLQPLNDRQLLNRYERYLRGADRAVAWVSIQRTMNATGLLQQQLARLKAARDELAFRVIRPPKRWEAYLHQRVRETYAVNEGVLECLTNGRGWPTSRVEAELEETAARLRAEPTKREDHQRWMMLLALRDAQANEDPRARRLIQHLESRLGWRWKHVEVERMLAVVERP